MRANIHSSLTLFFFTYYILKIHPYQHIKTVSAYRDLFLLHAYFLLYEYIIYLASSLLMDS